MNIKDQIKSTDCYKDLNHIQQKMMLGKNRVEVIRHGKAMSELTSFDNWVQKVSPVYNIKTIVGEILAI